MVRACGLSPCHPLRLQAPGERQQAWQQGTRCRCCSVHARQHLLHITAKIVELVLRVHNIMLQVDEPRHLDAAKQAGFELRCAERKVIAA